MNTSEKITIFTDGSSRGNPGPGGWGAVIVDGQKVTELGGGDAHTTNNKMEINAAAEALAHVPKGSHVQLHTDSSYVINGITKWIKGWKNKGWIATNKEPVMNKDLWMKLDRAAADKQVTWKYVGGHIGILGNERCDHIATAFADSRDVKLYKGLIDGYDLPDILNISHDQESLKKKKSSSSKSSAKAYSYVSSVGGVIETHKTWVECEKRVKGAKGARYKKALSRENEDEIIKEFEMF